MNKLRFLEQCIEIIYAKDDATTAERLCSFYPVHYNRKHTEARVSTRLIPEVCRTFRGLNQGNIVDAPWHLQGMFWKELHARQHIEDLLAGSRQGNPIVTPTLTLMPHQQLGRNIAKVRDRYGFFFDTRTGKTPLSLAIMYDDIAKHPDHRWLVVCPLILIKTAWLEDASKFIPSVKTVNCHGATKAKRLEAIKQEGNIYFTNVESFATYKEYFEQKGFNGCIVDESSCMKSNKSKQTKALVDFAQQMKRFYLLSGRPSPNGLWEMYPQLKAIDYYSVPASYTAFKEHYFVNISYNPQYEKLELRPDMQQELIEHIAKYALYIDQSILETAGRTFHTVELEMPVALKKAYNKLKNELYIETCGKQITTTGAGAMYNKLRQIASGFVIDSNAVKENKFYDESNQEVYLLDDYRFKALDKLLKEKVGQSQAIIWCSYRYEFEYIKRMLGSSCAMIYGAISAADKITAIELFKAGKVQYLVAHPASAKFGLTLTNAHIAVYFSLTFSLEDWKQSSERIYGRVESQPLHCDYYVLLAAGAIDSTIYNVVLPGKHEASMALLNHLKGG